MERSWQRLDSTQWLLTDGSIPVIHQFVAVQFRPLLDQRSGAAGQLAVEDLAGRDRDLCFVLAVLGVEVRRWMIAEVCAVPRSDEFDRDFLRVGRERFDVGFVAGEHGSAGLGERYHERVDGGAGSSSAPEFCGSTSDRGRDVGLDDAGLEKAVRVGVPSGIAVKRLDEDHRRHERWPEPLGDEGSDERKRRLAA